MDQVKRLLTHYNELNQKLINAHASIQLGFSLLGVEVNAATLASKEFLGLLDTSQRAKLFKLATHYWEARWLLEMQSHNYDKRGTVQGLITRHRRWAMLMPCFVATVNTLPSFLTARYNDEGVWKSEVAINYLDLLIIDEAGQALPHMAAASFSLAKKALLVGDIYQIEPVWTLASGIDRANLRSVGLLEKDDDYESIWLKNNLLASSGNLMKVAHHKQVVQQYQDLEPGLYLTEHRRCYDSIINYCNRLIYHGHLQALKGEPTIPNSWPTMGFIHHESSSSTLGSSRINQQEAELIINWIKLNSKELLQLGNLEKSIAIITPFSMQARIIVEQLKKAGLSDIKAGTVHTFQGAEAELVIFSSVYGSNDKGKSKFYDRGSNLLNVAVSRAKTSFIAFGDSDVFCNPGANSPSSLLLRHLTPIEEKTRDTHPLA